MAAVKPEGYYEPKEYVVGIFTSKTLADEEIAKMLSKKVKRDDGEDVKLDIWISFVTENLNEINIDRFLS